MLHLPHIRPLTEFVDRLNAQKKFGDVPYFDPMDGGIKARVLFLYEKPGPKAFVSGFISRNNNDQTAENTFRLMQEAKLAREATCLWNTVPGWNGQIKITSLELTAGAGCLEEVFALLPKLKVLVLVGMKAQRIEKSLQLPKLKIVRSYHPSPKNQALAPDKWASIPCEWARVKDYL